MLPEWIRIEDGSAVADARRKAVAAAGAEGLDESQRGAAAIVASEIATNLHKHATGGEMMISRTSRLGAPGLEMLGIDRGPGIPDLARVFADGYSSSATAGTGLGAMRRMSHDFDIYSQSGAGTVLVTRVFREKPAHSMPFPAAAVLLAKKGEEASGDAWAIRRNGNQVIAMVADGLGHGAFAAQASQAAVDSFESSDAAAPGALLDGIHQALRTTRGAAVAIAALDTNTRRVRYAGLGNISGVVIGGQKNQHMVSHNGTAGHEARNMREFEYDMSERGTLVMHSDGVNTSWNVTRYPGLIERHPALLAGVLYRDANRERDDVCVLAIRF